MEGDVINLTDVSGMRPDCSPKPDKPGPTPRPKLPAPPPTPKPDPNVPDKTRYLNASVIISFNDNASCDTQSLITVVGSLGALTYQGLWTHDHHIGAEKYWPKRSNDANEGLIYIRSWRCITFTGSRQSITVRPASINLRKSSDGAMLLSSDVIDYRGNPRSLLDLGNPIQQDTSWDPTQMRLVTYAHVRGVNNSLREHGGFLFHEYIDLMSGRIGTTGPFFDRESYILEERSELDYGDLTEEGDSGGGVFTNGELVGINLGVSRSIRDGVTYFNHHFVPITRPVRNLG